MERNDVSLFSASLWSMAVLPFWKRAIIARHHPRGYLISSPKDHVTGRRGGGKITEEAEPMGTSAIKMANTYQDV